MKTNHSINNSCTANVLLVDKDPQMAQAILRILARKAIRGIIVADHKAALESIEKNHYQMVFTSACFDTAKSIPQQLSQSAVFIKQIKARMPEAPTILIADINAGKRASRDNCVDLAVRALQAGFSDFLIKPVAAERLEDIFNAYLPNHKISTLAAGNQDMHNLYKIVGRSPKLMQTLELAQKVAPTSAPVLISGESGTGKELISYMIHNQSKRAEGPYVRVNCAALSESLLESELFGHEKGAFTGAHAQRKGRFEMAHGGTLLLDEITETPPRFQAKLLRILEQNDFERVGGSDTISVNVRIISTTNKDLAEEVAHKRFRADLYYRLSAVRIIVNPLRQRTDDLQDLIWHFVNTYSAEVSRQITQLDPSMLDIFNKYHWPGNVRQLRNVIRTSMILGNGPILSLADVSWLFDELQPLSQSADDYTVTAQDSRSNDLAGLPLVKVEERAIIETLRQTDGNQTKAAKALGISDRTLRCKIKKYRQQGVLQPV